MTIGNLKIGEHFLSKSKIQEHPIEYIYRGKLKNGYYYIEASSGKSIDDCEVDAKWFDNRIIKIFN